MKVKHLICLSMAFIVFFKTTNAQNYISLGDNTGANILSNYTTLNQIASDLVDTLPTTFQNQFKVFTVGFYLNANNFQGGIPEEFSRAIDSADIKSNYSLLIGRESRITGIYSKFWVRIKLPQSGIFSCFNDSDLAYIHSKIYNVLNKGVDDNNITNYAILEKKAIIELTNIISKAKSCCIGGRSPVECLQCPETVSEIRDMMELYGFIKMGITSLTKTNKTDTVGNVDEYAELTVTSEGLTINVNSDIEPYLNKMGNKMAGVSGKILYYDALSTNCDDIKSVIIEGQPELFSLTGAKNTSRITFEDFTFKVTVIGTIDELGIPALHIRIEEIKTENPISKIFYLQCLEGCGLNLGIVRDTFEEYFSLLKYIKPGNGYQFQDEEIHFDPTVIILPDYLPISFVRQNTVILFGLPSQLIFAVQNQYKSISGVWGDPENAENDVYTLISKDVANLEKGINPGNIALVRTDLETELQRWSCTSKEQLAAFLSFHAIGHNSGVNHEYNGEPNVKFYFSYMSQGCVIVQCFFGNFCGCKLCDAGDPDYSYKNPHDLIKRTMEQIKEPTHFFNTDITGKIYARFFQ
jgi:hypothetical protein